MHLGNVFLITFCVETNNVFNMTMGVLSLFSKGGKKSEEGERVGGQNILLA